MTILSYLREHLQPALPLAEDLARAVDRAADRVDPLLRTVSGYERRLAPAVVHAIAHCASLVTSLPGPIDIHGRAFVADPLVHGIFPAVDDIATTLGRSRAVREFLAAPSPDRAENFYALLGVRRHEKNVMGMALWGDLVRGDSPQTLLYFTDHTLFGVAAELDESRRLLRDASFDSLVAGFVAEQGEKGHPLLEEKLAALAAWLAAAEEHLKLEPFSVTVDLLGVETGDGAPGAHRLFLPELAGRDRRRWSVVLGRFSRAEALAAVERQEHAHRYMVI